MCCCPPDLLLLLLLSLVSDRLLGHVLREDGSLAFEVDFAILSDCVCIVAAGLSTGCGSYSLKRSAFFGEREEECSIVATVLLAGLD